MAKKKDRWFIPTNTENLKMIIAQGLICSSRGFKKYYSDVLELVEGYIPIFKNQVQQEILTYVIRKEEDLTPAIIEIDLKKIIGSVKKIEDNRLIDVELSNIDNVDVLFIQVALPLSVISKVVFKSNEDKKTFEDDSKLYSNVVLAESKFSSTVLEQKLFKLNTLPEGLLSELKSIKLEDTAEVDYQKVYAYGGLLLNLFYFAKNGKISNNTYKLFSEFKEEKFKQDMDIYDYFKAFNTDDINVKKKMDYGLIDTAINSKDFKEDVLDFLLSDIWDEKSKKRTEELANKLKIFESNTDKTISEQFAESKTPLERILMMLFLREDSEALVDYNLELFTEKDYINFAMMFGIRDKFIKMPKELREFSVLQGFVSQKMAEYAHNTMESNIRFKPTVKPLTLMELFNKTNLKKRLIKELKVESCIKTIMPNKEYSSRSGINTYIGFIEPKYELLEEEYFKILSKRKITKDEYNKFAKMK